MNFGEAREQLVGEENRHIAQTLNIFERAYSAAHEKVTNRIRDLFKGLKGARDDANGTRNGYTTKENIENLARLLRDRGQLREGSYLARDVQRVLDALGSGGDSSSVAEIPGEYKRMYDRIEELEQSGKFSYGDNGRRSDYQGASSMPKIRKMLEAAKVLDADEMTKQQKIRGADGRACGVLRGRPCAPRLP